MDSFSHNMSEQEHAIKNFLRDYSNKPKDGQTIYKILSETFGYYGADRSYIFELDGKCTHISNTYEWCREGVSPAIDSLQDISLEDKAFWLKELEEKGELYISSLQEKVEKNSMTYQLLNTLGIESVAAAPLTLNGSVIGFVGVNNPHSNTDQLLLLSVIASACCSEIVNERLENSNNAFLERMKIIQSMSEIYTAVYYIDIENDNFIELSSVEPIHRHIGSSGNAQEKLNYFCRWMMTSDYTDELLQFVDLSTLNERMKNEKVISKQFICTIPLSEEQNNTHWAQCSFIECGYMPDGRLSHVVFATQTINDTKVKELEQQKKVEKINEILKDETEIAGALSRDYSDVVLLDLKDDTAVTIKCKGNIIAEENRVTRRSYYETWNNYIAKYVVEDDREALKAAIVIEKVKDALEKSDEYSCSYRVFSNEIGHHHFQASFIRFYSRNKAEDQIILGFRCVDAIVEEEHKNRTIQEEQLRIIDALSREYSSLFKIDATTGNLSLYRTDGISMKSGLLNMLMEYGGYEEVLSKYIDTYIVPEDQKRIREVKP